MYINISFKNRLLTKLKTWLRYAAKPRYINNLGIVLDTHSAALKESKNIVASLYNGTYESAEIGVLDRVLEPGDKIIEIGAGVGLVTTFLKRRLGNESVFSYEANPELRSQIEQTLALNGAQADGLTAAGISSQAGKRTFYVTYPDFWSSTFGPLNMNEFCGIERVDEIELEMLSLDDELKRTGANVVLMDIEGGEHDLLCNSKLEGVEKLVFEIHPYIIGDAKVTEIISSLHAKGFMLHLRLSHPQVLCFSRCAQLDALEATKAK